MRLYLDTSALLKLYVEEPGSLQVEQAAEGAQTMATSMITYVETKAALSRRRRDGSLTVTEHKKLVRDFESDWKKYFVIEASETLIRNAGKFAEVHALRGYDAIQLASAAYLQTTLGEVVTFASWDDRLEAAATRQGLRILRSRWQ